MHKSLGFFRPLSNSSFGEVEEGGSEVQIHPRLHGEFKTSLATQDPTSRKNKQPNNKIFKVKPPIHPPTENVQLNHRRAEFTIIVAFGGSEPNGKLGGGLWILNTNGA